MRACLRVYVCVCICISLGQLGPPSHHSKPADREPRNLGGPVGEGSCCRLSAQLSAASLTWVSEVPALDQGLEPDLTLLQGGDQTGLIHPPPVGPGAGGSAGAAQDLNV